MKKNKFRLSFTFLFICLMLFSGCTANAIDGQVSYKKVEYDIDYAPDDSIDLWTIVKKKPDRLDLEYKGVDFMVLFAKKTDTGYDYDETIVSRKVKYNLGDKYDETKDGLVDGNVYECVGYQIVPFRFKKKCRKYSKEVFWTKESYEKGFGVLESPELKEHEVEYLVSQSK